MTDMFSFMQNNNENSNQFKFSEYNKHKQLNNAIASVSLTQGDKFINYQNKIKTQANGSKKNNLFSNDLVKEGFSESYTDELNLKRDSNKLLSNVQLSSADKDSFKTLKKEYAITLKIHQELQSKIRKQSKSYLNRVNPSANPYLGKHISLGGPTFYVTKQGVAKYYPSTDIYTNTAGLNGCPSPNDVIQLDIPWDPKYSVAGAIIPTTPPLVTGDPMTYGQSCGNEGENVYVSLPIDMSANYVGTYIANATTPMTFIGGAPGTIIVIQNPNFTYPVLSNNSYNYYGSASSTDSKSIPGWMSNGGAIINNSSAWGYPMPYPSGSQACSIQMLNSISQTFSNVETGTYTLTLQACGRNCCDGSQKCNPIDVQLNGSTFYSINVPVNVWTPIKTSFTITQQGTNTITFLGTTGSNQDRSTAIQDLRIVLSDDTGSRGTYTYDECAQAAATGYQYFALQSADASGNGYCAVTNDYVSATQPGNSYTTDKATALWSSNTTTGAYAQLTSLGTLQVYDSNGTSVFSTPAPTDSNYWGCYLDQEVYGIGRSLPGGPELYNYNSTSCNKYARKHRQLIYGLQDNQGPSNAWCSTGTDLTKARAGGIATNCSKDPSGNIVGGGWSNAMYGARPGFACFIALQSDGNMCIYRGQGLSDNQGAIWCSGTNGKQQDANPNWAASTGKYSSGVSNGSNIAPNGYNAKTGSDNQFILYPGEYFSDPSGLLKLVMQTDGNLVLYTSTMRDNYTTDANGNRVGGVNANALYNYGSVPIPADVGTLAYIDGNGTSHVYLWGTSTLKNDDYAHYPALQQTGYQYSINGQQSSVMSLDDCKTTCTNDSGCGGITYNNADNRCYYNDNAVSLFATYPNNTFDTYMKNKKPTDPIYSNVTNNITATEYSKYPSGNNMSSFTGSYDLAAATAVDMQKLSQLEDKLNQLTSELSKYTTKFSNDTTSVINQTKTNLVSTKKNLTETAATEDIIKQQKHVGSNLEGILNDSNIVVLQENYNYAAWSILAIGVVIISMNLVKK